MKYIINLIIAFVWFSTVCGQMPTESQKYIAETLSNPNLDKEELLSRLSNLDYASLWTKNDKAILGFIGDNHQRINVKYLSVIKNFETHVKYYFYGKSRVGSNVCQFLGEIELIHIRKIDNPERKQLYEEAKRQNDEEAILRFSKEKYILLAKYKFFEDYGQKETGIFDGILKSMFYIESGKVLYDDLEIESDIFSNNQYVGLWTSYADSIVKRCNWGEYRIPNSGDLDIGVAEFSPNTKYLSKGWETFYKAYIQDDINAQKDEKFEWWKK